MEVTTLPAVIHDTFVIKRSYAKPPERVYAAFANANTKRRWYAEGHNHVVEAFTMDFRVGGVEIARYRFDQGGPVAGMVLTHEGRFVDLVANRRIVTSSAMSIAGKVFSASLVTIELLETETGTDLICTHQGAFLEGADGPQQRRSGWSQLLDQLATELARSGASARP
jgi:uncharacterized protein YndB with AHSA1/START domain